MWFYIGSILLLLYHKYWILLNVNLNVEYYYFFIGWILLLPYIEYSSQRSLSWMFVTDWPTVPLDPFSLLYFRSKKWFNAGSSSVPAAVSDNCPILPFLQTPLGGYNRAGTPPPPITLIAGILQQLSHPRSRPEVTAKAHAPQFWFNQIATNCLVRCPARWSFSFIHLYLRNDHLNTTLQTRQR